jgi:hypothetical protein
MNQHARLLALAAFSVHAMAFAAEPIDYRAKSREVGARAVLWTEASRFDFNGTALTLADWPTPEGEWQLVDGELVATAGEHNRVIQVDVHAPGPVRIAFDAVCEANADGRIGDITVLLNSAPDKRFFRSGYALTIGSYYNNCATFYRFGKPFAKTEHSPVVAGRRHRVVVTFVDGHIRYWLDDKLVLEAWDPEPIVPAPNRHVGLRTWNTRLRIDNLVISRAADAAAARPKPARSYDCVRRSADITVDGQLAESCWQTTDWLRVDQPLGDAQLEQTEVCLVWDDIALYAAARLRDEHIAATMSERDSRVWREECLEFFFDPRTRGQQYYEINVNALGACYDAANTVDASMHRTVMESAWNPENTTIATRRTEDGWHLEMRVRFDSMPAAPRVPPLHGDLWRANVFRINALSDGTISNAAWAPTKAFHDPARFGAIRFLHPARAAAQQQRIAAAAALFADPGAALSRPLSARLQAANVHTTDGTPLTYDNRRRVWRDPTSKTTLAVEADADVPGVVEARLDGRGLRVSWTVAAPGRFAFLAHLYPKAVEFRDRGKADGAMLRAALPGVTEPISLLINRAEWQLQVLEPAAAGALTLTIDPGPAGNDMLDKIYFALYELGPQ